MAAPARPAFSPSKFSLARQRAERLSRGAFFALTAIPLVLLLALLVLLVTRFWPILSSHSLIEMLSGTTWKPQQGRFGYLPFITSTLWVTGLGVGLAVPPCILVAIYLSEFARAKTRALAKPLLDLLAALPSVVYGVWGILVIVPFVGGTLQPFLSTLFAGVPFFAANQPTGYSVLSGALVLAVMITPFIISIIYEVLASLPQGLRRASLAVGATRWQTTWNVLLPQAFSGILAAIVLGLSRALGETMAVLMVVGNVAQIPTSIFDAAYPLPALIANNYGEMMSIPLFDSALLGAGLLLLVIIFVLNLLSAFILQKFVNRSVR